MFTSQLSKWPRLLSALQAAQCPKELLRLLRGAPRRGELFGASASHVHWLRALGAGHALWQLWRMASRLL